MSIYGVGTPRLAPMSSSLPASIGLESEIGFSPSIAPTESAGGISGTSAASPTSFTDALEQAVNAVNEAQKVSAVKAGEMSTGKTSIDEAMISMEKADLGFRMMTQVRNRVIDAYREVMRMNF